MRILIVNTIFGRGSSGRSIADLRDNLIKSGNDVCVATPHNIQDEGFYRIGNSVDHKVHAILSRLIGMQGYFSKKATKKFINYIEECAPDIIHMQVIHGNFINFPMFMKYVSSKKIPLVIVLDDCWYFTGKCCHYTSDKCYKWKQGCYRCPRKKSDNPSWFFDFSKKMYRDKKKIFENVNNYAVVAVSDWLKGEAQQSYLVSAKYLTRIYNAIDIEQFQYIEKCNELKESLGVQGKKIILGVATSWKDSKGLSKGIKLFAELAQMLPDDFRIVLVGKMDEGITIPDNIISIDFVDGPGELAKYYSMADVFVQMSSEETFGKVTAESLCCGTPVIVFDSTANPELVGENCGFVVQNKNVQQVYEKVLEITENGKKKYSSYCRDFAVRNFESKQNADKFIELYSKLVDGEM